MKELYVYDWDQPLSMRHNEHYRKEFQEDQQTLHVSSDEDEVKSE